MWALMLDPRLGVINDMLVKIGVLDRLQGLVRRSQYRAGRRPRWSRSGTASRFSRCCFWPGSKRSHRSSTRPPRSTARDPSSKFRLITLPQLKDDHRRRGGAARHQPGEPPDIILILTGGGPGRSTLVLSLYAFLKVNKEFNFGYGSAIAVVLFMLLMAFSYLYVRLSNVDEGLNHGPAR